MRFYLCDTVVPFYARTLADVPAGASYEAVEVPTDHKGLTEFINTLIAKVSSPPPTPREETKAPGQVTEGPHQPDPHPTPAPVKPKKTDWHERSMDQTACEQHIHDIRDDEAHRLDVLQSCIDNRRAEIARKAEAVQPVAPRARVRKAS